MEDKNILDNSPVLYNLLFSASHYPNIIFPLLSGILVDKIGYAKSTILATICFALGQVLFYFGAVLGNFKIVFISKMLLGVGHESFSVSNNVTIMSWFSQDQLSFALVLIISFGKFGTLTNSWITPDFAENYGYKKALLLGILFISVGVILTFVMK